MVMLLLCSDIAQPGRGLDTTRPLSLREWNALAAKIADSSIKTPAAFLEYDPDVWGETLELSETETDRLKELLSRGGNLGIELERLENIGIWVTTRIEEEYPSRLKTLLKNRAPIYLFGAGGISFIENEGIAIVGSRDVDEIGADFTAQLAYKCAEEGLTVISGGARGVDQIAQRSAYEAGGKVISVLPQGLEKAIRKRDMREALLSDALCLLSTAHSKAPFNVGLAMERNKYIYTLARYAVVVSSAHKKGGTWEGAMENLKNGWVPLVVRSGESIPEGNRRLIDEGGFALSADRLKPKSSIREWLSSLDTEEKKQGGARDIPIQDSLPFEE